MMMVRFVRAVRAARALGHNIALVVEVREQLIHVMVIVTDMAALLASISRRVFGLSESIVKPVNDGERKL